jgi:hypothetical protein
MSGLTGFEYGLIGAAVGAGLTQLVPVVNSITAARSRRRENEAKHAERLEAKRRPLYMDLIKQTTHAQVLVYDVSDAIESEANLPENWVANIKEFVSRIDDRIIEIRVDGSADARKIIEDLDRRLCEYNVHTGPPDEKHEYPAWAAEAIRVLAEASQEMIGLARAEFGG